MNRTGIVLAGGESKRFGSDKAIYQFQGKSMLKHSIDLLSHFCDPIYISGEREEYSIYGYPCIPDRFPRYGPLTGIASTLPESKDEVNVVVTCDMPLVTQDMIAKLLLEHKAGQVTLFTYRGHRYFFPMVIDHSLLSLIARVVDRGNQTIEDLIREANIQEVEADEDTLHCLANVNEQQDIDSINTLSLQ